MGLFTHVSTEQWPYFLLKQKQQQQQQKRFALKKSSSCVNCGMKVIKVSLRPYDFSVMLHSISRVNLSLVAQM